MPQHQNNTTNTQLETHTNNTHHNTTQHHTQTQQTQHAINNTNNNIKHTFVLNQQNNIKQTHTIITLRTTHTGQLTQDNTTQPHTTRHINPNIIAHAPANDQHYTNKQGQDDIS